VIRVINTLNIVKTPIFAQAFAANKRVNENNNSIIVLLILLRKSKYKKKMKMMNRVLLICGGVLIMSSCNTQPGNKALTEITRWPDDKKGAASITYDDGTVNQFRKAVPVMNDLNLKGTFFINTGAIKGSQYRGTFIGRPVQEIIIETANIPTNADNFFERSSAAAYLGLKGTLQYHHNAGSRIDAGNPDRAYKTIDELYEKVRRGEFQRLKGESYEVLDEVDASWDDLR
jgi:hypothetical protein